VGTKHEQLERRYATGDVPWDDPLPPPEVQETVASRTPGRALDLGCGYGRTTIYLARRGWEVDGVDFVALALAEAERRAGEASVFAAFHNSSVTEISFLAPFYDVAIDVGCGHNLDAAGWHAYHDCLRFLLRPGALFMLFSRLGGEEAGAAGDSGPGGLDEPAFLRLFANGFRLKHSSRGETAMPDASWASAWYWLRREGD
jgi:cyclopropane fatty-acyl-phospholipid synthase-like methyltransferase